MARRSRDNPNGPWHHVMNRGARHQAVFLDDTDRENFLDVVARACDRYDVEVHAYCLMDNHYHLLLNCRDGNVSRFMQYLASIYTQRFNRRHGFDGALFRGRFHSVSVESDEQLVATSRYVHRNPLDIGDVQESDLGNYQWSSLRWFLAPATPHPRWLVTDLTLALYDIGTIGYQTFVVTPPLTTASTTPITGTVISGTRDTTQERYAAMASTRSITVSTRAPPPSGSP